MLVAAHSQPVALHVQSQTVSGQRMQLDAYPASVPATVLPVSVPMSVPVPMPVSVQMQVQVPQVSPPVQQAVEEPVVVPVHERLLAAQLAHLASQHHASEYNRFKFGQKGSPVAYVPLSLQAPGHIRELRARQAAHSEQSAWWLSERGGSISREKPARQETQACSHVQTLPTMLTASSSDLQQEISAAISSQMPSAHITKTSQSHPISISMVIPFEVLSSIASRLISPWAPSPVMFHLPENCHLDRVTAVPAHGAQTFSPFHRSGNPLFLPPVQPRVPITWAQQGSSELLQNALNGEFSFSPPRPLFVPSQERYGMQPPTELPSPPFALPRLAPTPPSPPKGVIRRHPRQSRAMSAPPAFQILKGMQRRTSNLKELRQGLVRNRSNPEVPVTRSEVPPSVVPSTVLALESAGVDTDSQEDKLSNNANGRGPVLPPVSVVQISAPQSTPMPVFGSAAPEDPGPFQQLGNLYLSSCPGKKVRLSGPVKGRGAICRDLRADLSRVKELGVRCIICCLDDNELDFLGASWFEYSSVANELGLDVLRIPMPEGLAPLSPASLDAHLKRIIEAYTLRGVPVLAHCRGGVGRAGLVACCWMLKLGLCGWKDPEVCVRSCSEHAYCSELAKAPLSRGTMHERGRLQAQLQIQAQTWTQTQSQSQSRSQSSGTIPANVPRVCRATVQLVERALAVMRRRRSLKAVETYEQVRFLVDFIEYLDMEARLGGRVCVE